MAVKIDMEVVGVDKLQAALTEVGSSIGKAVINPGLEDAGKLVASDARRRIPKDTGRTADQIESQRKGRVVRIGIFDNGTGSRGYVGRMLENGTSKMRARPWLRPALYENVNGIVEVFRSKIDALLSGAFR